MNLVEINEFDLKKYVEIAYEDDIDLLNHYHVDQYDFDGAVTETLRMIEATAQGLDMRYYGVCQNKEKIGYLCTLPNNLYSFGINIDNRTKETLSAFWVNIKDVLGKSFICMLYPNNTRAINWLEKCGMVVVPDVEDNCVTLLNIK